MRKSKKRKKKQPLINFNSIKKPLSKIVAVLLLLAMNSAGIYAITGTSAYYSDQEQSVAAFTAGTVDFSLGSPADFTPAVTPATTTFKSIHFNNDGNLDLRYDLDLADISDDPLCDKLLLTVKLGSTDVYSGPLTDFTATSTIPGMTSAAFNWTVSLTDNDEALKNRACSFDLHIFGWELHSPDSSQSFTDNETISNTVSSGEWANTPVISAGDVVINELMWMGSKDDEGSSGADDEWIELKNMTDHDIDLSNWDISNGGTGSGPGSHLEIPHGYAIKANGYFLITKNKWDETRIKLEADLPSDEGLTRKSGMNLLNGGEELVLKDSDGLIIDSAGADDASWPAGSNGSIKKSMERNDAPGDGNMASNWHTCEPSGMTAEELVLMKSYWDGDAQNNNCGTPLHSNLSFEPVMDSGLGASEPSVVNDLLDSIDAGAIIAAEDPGSEAAGQNPPEPSDIPEDIPLPPKVVIEPEPVLEPEPEAIIEAPAPVELIIDPDPAPVAPAEIPADSPSA